MKVIGEPDDGNGRKVATMSSSAVPGFGSGRGTLAPVQRASEARLGGMGIGHGSWRWRRRRKAAADISYGSH